MSIGRNLPPQRRGLYYLGIVLIIVGLVSLLSLLASMGDTPPENFVSTIVLRAIFMVMGIILTVSAARGWLGSDEPDPNKARPEDEESVTPAEDKPGRQ